MNKRYNTVRTDKDSPVYIDRSLCYYTRKGAHSCPIRWVSVLQPWILRHGISKEMTSLSRSVCTIGTFMDVHTASYDYLLSTSIWDKKDEIREWRFTSFLLQDMIDQV